MAHTTYHGLFVVDSPQAGSPHYKIKFDHPFDGAPIVVVSANDTTDPDVAARFVSYDARSITISCSNPQGKIDGQGFSFIVFEAASKPVR